MAARTPARRRQRGVRVSVAVGLLSGASVAVVAALPTLSVTLLGVSAVLAVVLGWASARILWTEVTTSRREHARERASQARAYRKLFAERAAEHAELTASMTGRLLDSEIALREMQGRLDATRAELDRLRASDDPDAVASWEAGDEDQWTAWPAATDPVVDLVAWERAASARTSLRRHA